MRHPPRRVYLDCCAILNVYATSRFHEVLSVISTGATPAFGVARHVLTHEVLYIRGVADDEREPVDLLPFIGDLIAVEEVESDAEAATFVSLAVTLDDGEAETVALAHHRSGAVATDDLAAIRAMSELAPPVPVIRTSEIMKSWVTKLKPSAVVVRQALNDIRERARFVPGPADPLRKWWLQRAA